jgi:uncharacterized protein YkwD
MTEERRERLPVSGLAKAATRGAAAAPASAMTQTVLVALLSAIALVGCATPAFAKPSLVDTINAARADGCGGGRGISVPLRSNRKLDAVAKRVSKGEQLSRALPKVGYRALHSATMFMSNVRDNTDVANFLARRACGELRNKDVTEIGVERRGADVWVVLAQPFGAPELENASAVSQRILKLANEARARSRRCGGTQFSSAPPLKLENRLNDAASVQARDMAKHDMLEHEGTDGSTPATRVTRQGYTWRTVGENIASGPTSADEVMEGWLDSPGHCANLMNPRFTEMGIGFVVDPRSESGVYWSQVFATPK